MDTIFPIGELSTLYNYTVYCSVMVVFLGRRLSFLLQYLLCRTVQQSTTRPLERAYVTRHTSHDHSFVYVG